MAEGVGEAEPEAVVGCFVELEREAGFEAEAAADEDEGDVFEGMAVAFAEFVGPEEGGVVEEGSIAAGFGGVGELAGEAGDLLAEPDVDFDELFLRTLVEVGVVGEGVVAFVDAEPFHAGLADGVGELEGGDAGHVVREDIDEEIGLQAGRAGHVVIAVVDAGFEGGRGVSEGMAGGVLEVLFEFADEGGVFLEEGAVFGGHAGGDAVEVLAEGIEDAAEVFAILHLAVELLEELVGVGDGGDGLVGAGVSPAGPGVGAVGDGDAEFEGAEASAGVGLGLEVVLEFLVDRRPAGPAGGGIGAALDVAREQFDPGEEATHAAHVSVAVATDAVTKTFDDQGAVFEGGEGFEDALELEVGAGLVRPEMGGDDAVGAEDEDETLFGFGGGRGEAGQSGEEGESGGGEAELADELASRGGGHGGGGNL